MPIAHDTTGGQRVKAFNACSRLICVLQRGRPCHALGQPHRRQVLSLGALLAHPFLADARANEGSTSFLPSSQLPQLSSYQVQVLEYNKRIQKQNNSPPDFPGFIRDKFNITIVGDSYQSSPEGLIYKDFKVGEGPSPRDGEEVTFAYTAYNESGGLIDSTYRQGRNATTQIGINGLIPGFELGIKGMQVGGQRRIVVSPELGPPIGPSTFFSAKQCEVFDVELLGIKPCRREGILMFSRVGSEEGWLLRGLDHALRSFFVRQERELIRAATLYKEGVKDGAPEDHIIASILGSKDSKSLSGVGQEYKDKLKEQIAKKAAEMEGATGAGREEYEYGVRLYERGRYADSERMLRTALDVAGPFNRLGGDVQLQLALACSATGKEEECITILKELEESHPLRAVAKQAKDLRFILEAPKLAIKDDEKVSVPHLDKIDPSRPKRGGPRPAPRPGSTQLRSKPETERSFEDEFWDKYEPPRYLTNRYVWFAAIVVGTCAAYYSYVYKDCIPQ